MTFVVILPLLFGAAAVFEFRSTALRVVLFHSLMTVPLLLLPALRSWEEGTGTITGLEAPLSASMVLLPPLAVVFLGRFTIPGFGEPEGWLMLTGVASAISWIVWRGRAIDEVAGLVVVALGAYHLRRRASGQVFRVAELEFFGVVAASLAAGVLWPEVALDEAERGAFGQRLEGLLFHPNLLGWCALVGILLLARRTYGIPSLVGLAEVCIFTIALAWTDSRTAIALAAAVVVLLLSSWVPSGAWLLKGVGWAVAAIIVGVVGYTFVTGVASPDDADVGGLNGRTRIWRHTLGAVDDPVLGYGPGVWTEEFIRENADASWRDFDLTNRHAHNQFVQQYAEAGLLGLLALSIFYTSLARRAIASGSLVSAAAAGVLLLRSMFETPLTLHTRGSGVAALVAVLLVASVYSLEDGT